MGVDTINKMTMIANDKIGNMLDKTVGKFTDKLSSSISKGLTKSIDVVAFGNKSNKEKPIKYTFKNNTTTAGIKTSDTTTTDIKRTFQSTF